MVSKKYGLMTDNMYFSFFPFYDLFKALANISARQIGPK